MIFRGLDHGMGDVSFLRRRAWMRRVYAGFLATGQPLAVGGGNGRGVGGPETTTQRHRRDASRASRRGGAEEGDDGGGDDSGGKPLKVVR